MISYLCCILLLAPTSKCRVKIVQNKETFKKFRITERSRLFLALFCTHILFCGFLSIKFVCKNIPTVLIEKTQVLVKTTHCCPILLFVLCPLNSCITLCGDFTTGPFSLHTGVIYFAILTQGWSLAEMFHTVYEGTQVQGVYMCQYAFVLGITLK